MENDIDIEIDLNNNPEEYYYEYELCEPPDLDDENYDSENSIYPGCNYGDEFLDPARIEFYDLFEPLRLYNLNPDDLVSDPDSEVEDEGIQKDLNEGEISLRN